MKPHKVQPFLQLKFSFQLNKFTSMCDNINIIPYHAF